MNYLCNFISNKNEYQVVINLGLFIIIFTFWAIIKHLSNTMSTVYKNDMDNNDINMILLPINDKLQTLGIQLLIRVSI